MKIIPAASKPSTNESVKRYFPIEIRPYNFKDLRNLYRLGYRAMRTAIEPIMEDVGKPEGNYYNVHQVEKIVNYLGRPYVLE